MSKIETAHNNLVALIQAEARPYGIAAPDWPPIISDPDPAKVIPVITYKVGDIETFVKSQLQRLGIGIVVLIPLIRNATSGEAMLELGLRFVVIVTENPLLNKTGKSSLAVYERVMKVVNYQPNGVTPGDETETSRFIVDPTAVEQMPPPNQKELASVVANNININTQIEI